MVGTVLLSIGLTDAAALGLAQALPDGDIRAAIERGKVTPEKKLWNEVGKKAAVSHESSRV